MNIAAIPVKKKMPLDAFKIEYFAAENPGQEYPLELALPADEVRRTRENVLMGLLGQSASERELLSEIYSGGCMLDVDILSDDFKLREALASAGITPTEMVYVYFVLADGLDVGYRAKLDRLSRYLDDVWYPPMDDLLIVDAQFKWLLLLAHWGMAKLHLLNSAGGH
jgi:hypothetical protein